LARLKNAPSAEQERKKLKDSLVNVSKKRIKIAREYTDLARSIYKGQLECTNAGLEWLQALTNHTALKALCAEKDAKYTQAVAKFNDSTSDLGLHPYASRTYTHWLLLPEQFTNSSGSSNN
jgi:hypothetical protein